MTAPLSPEGRLTIDLTRDAGRLPARIASTRSTGIGRIFAGRDPREVLAIVPHIFTLCGVAHTVAAVEAYEEAHGVAVPPATRNARHTAVAFETAREHLLRMMLDWPQFLGEEPDKTRLPQIMGLLPTARKALAAGGDPFQPGADVRIDGTQLEAAVAALGEVLQTSIFGETAGAWLTRQNLAEWTKSSDTSPARFIRLIIERGWQRLGGAATHFLPDLDRAELIASLDGEGGEDFIAAPLWDGQPRETTPLARQQSNPLVADLAAEYGYGFLTRAVARLAELTALLRNMSTLAVQERTSAQRGPKGTGLVQVEAARGRLIHYLRADGDRVASYAILAPTDWNFHPRGAAVKALEDLDIQDTEALREAANMVMNLIDPCVAYELKLHNPQAANRESDGI